MNNRQFLITVMLFLLVITGYNQFVALPKARAAKEAAEAPARAAAEAARQKKRAEKQAYANKRAAQRAALKAYKQAHHDDAACCEKGNEAE